MASNWQKSVSQEITDSSERVEYSERVEGTERREKLERREESERRDDSGTLDNSGTMEDDGTDGDKPSDTLNYDPALCHLLITPLDPRPIRRSSFSSLGSEENLELTGRGESEPQNQQQNKNTNLHWLYIVGYLVLSSISIACSIAYLCQLIRNYKNLTEYWIFILSVVLVCNSLAILFIVFPVSKQRSAFPVRSLVHCLLCALCNLVSSTIIFYIHYEWIMAVVLVSSILLLVLLCLPGMKWNFAV